MSSFGFTGSSKKVPEPQSAWLAVVLEQLKSQGYTTQHNGDCIEADALAFKLWKNLGGEVIGHPPSDSKKRAFCKFDCVMPVAPYLERNKHIVDASKLLVACPDGHEVLRSGVWATVRYARKKGIHIVIVYPDGSVVTE